MKKMFKKLVSYGLALTLAFGSYSMPVTKVDAAAETIVLNNWTHEYVSWEFSDAEIMNSVAVNTDTGFDADISITGWQRMWEAENPPENAVIVGGGWGDRPYQLRSYTRMEVVPGAKYRLSFEVTNEMLSSTGNPTEKNITVTVDSGMLGDSNNIFLFETVRIPADSTETFIFDLEIPTDYIMGIVDIELAYGCYAYSYEVEKAGRTEEILLNDVASEYLLAPGTTEDVLCKGKLSISNASLTCTYKPVEVDTGLLIPVGIGVKQIGDKAISIGFEESETAKELDVFYKIYMDDELIYGPIEWSENELYNKFNVSVGEHKIEVKAYYNGVESDGIIGKIYVKKIYSLLDNSYNPTVVLASSPVQNSILVAWTESEQAKADGATYNIYLDGELVRNEIAYATQYLPDLKSGMHTVTVTAVLDGAESSGTSYSITLYVKPIELSSAVVLSQADNSITVLWTETSIQVANEQTYNVYVDDELVLSNVAAGLHEITKVDGGEKVVRVTAVKDGLETTGVSYTVTVNGKMISYAELEINGFQISAVAEGFRTIYSVGDKKNQVVNVGLVYGLSDYVDPEDMVVDSDNKYVYNFNATENGKMDRSYSKLDASTSYTMTMQFGDCTADFCTADTMVRVYAQLSDGSYVYSDIATYNVYEVADALYQDVLMNNLMSHEYLYTDILTRVNPDYKEVDFTWGTAVIEPYK